MITYFIIGTSEGIMQYPEKHNSPFDRGGADSYYNRPRDPHKWVESKKITDLTDEEIEAYNAGYDENEKYGDKKDWGW